MSLLLPILLVPFAAAHADPAPHVHGVSPLGVAVLAAWILAAALLWRGVAARAA